MSPRRDQDLHRSPASAAYLLACSCSGRAGVTIHLIEPTLDTGAILAQERAHPPVGSDPARMRVENVIVARRSLPEAVEALLQGTAEPVAQGGARTPVYRLRDLTLERRVELLRRLGHPL